METTMFTILVVISISVVSGLALSAVMAKSLNVSSGVRNLEDMEQMASLRRGDRNPHITRRTWPDPRSTSEGPIAG